MHITTTVFVGMHMYSNFVTNKSIDSLQGFAL